MPEDLRGISRGRGVLSAFKSVVRPVKNALHAACAHTHTAHPITIRRCACAYHTCARVHTDYDTARAGVGTYACWTLVKMRGEKTSEFALSIVMHVRLGWDGTRTGRNREREIDACETMSRLGLALTGHGGTAHSAPPPYLIFPLF